MPITFAEPLLSSLVARRSSLVARPSLVVYRSSLFTSRHVTSRHVASIHSPPPPPPPSVLCPLLQLETQDALFAVTPRAAPVHPRRSAASLVPVPVTPQPLRRLELLQLQLSRVRLRLRWIFSRETSLISSRVSCDNNGLYRFVCHVVTEMVRILAARAGKNKREKQKHAFECAEVPVAPTVEDPLTSDTPSFLCRVTRYMSWRYSSTSPSSASSFLPSK